ncbi:MAG: FGGY-family carbohydrate kinase [Microbacteriaceae bacterium]|nr:FGGY-family carbohydrate kinase [Microbacteriaceae bacterium]
MGAVLGVDIGTSSSKGVLVATDGRVLASAVREHAVSRPAPGHVEMAPQTWWEEFASIARELSGAAEPIAAVGVSGMGPCTALTDAAGTPLRPAILYGVDTRASAEIAELEEQLGAQRIVEAGGSALSSQAVGPKLAWLARHEPEVFARARRIFMPASWLAWQLTGRYVLDHHSASQCAPLYDTRALGWHESWASALLGTIEPPELVWADAVVGAVSPAAADTTGLPPGIPVISGTIDAWSEAISAGAHEPGDLMLMYGTTMFLVNTVEHRVVHPPLWSTIGAVPGTRSLAAGMASSGAITTWLRDVFGGPDFATLLTEAEHSGPGANGLLVLPYFAGERTPIQDPDARGIIAGLSLAHTRGDLYRAALEATAFGVRHNIEEMIAAGSVIERVTAVGGGTRGSLWTSIVSDVTGVAQRVPRVTIGASYGAAYLAARAVDDTARIEDWNPIEQIIRPDPGLRTAYDESYGRYLQLYPATAEISHALAHEQRR